MSATIAAPEFAATEVTIADLLHDVLRRWRLVAIVFVAVCVVGAIYTFTRVPVYRVEVLMAPASEGSAGAAGELAKFASQFGGVASMLGLELGDAGTKKEVALAILGSRRFLEKFALEHELMQLFYRDRWDAQSRTFRPGLLGRVPTMDDTLRTLNERVLSVQEDRRTGLVRLRIDWTDRQQAAEWANELVRRVNEMTRQETIAEARRSIEFLNRELKTTATVDLQQSIYRLIEAQLNRVTLAQVRTEYAFQVIDPAVAPAASNFVRPRRLRLLMVTAVAGLLASVFVATIVGRRRRQISSP